MNPYTLCPNHIIATLQKPAAQITRRDLIDYIADNAIRMVNFMYPAADGRLKTLNFVVDSIDHLTDILTFGERVDGSSLFTHIDPANSDLYVIPRYSTAFIDPFASIPTLTMLCRYFDKDGSPLDIDPTFTLEKALMEFNDTTGLRFQAMGELEFYTIAPTTPLFQATDQRGYHESAPFAKSGQFRALCMTRIAATGANIKYGHSEVGNFTLDNLTYEQNEIEFLPVDPLQAADQLILAKWIIRNTAAEMGLNVTFAPKITAGKAGSGLHIHMRLIDPENGRNIMLNHEGKLSDDALRLIAGLITTAPAITAFGNTNPTSYLRLVPHQEAPTNICWGDRNRSVLIRVPLGWTADSDLCAAVNPGSTTPPTPPGSRQTIEIRSADCSANISLLLAAILVAARRGWQLQAPLDIARQTYVDIDIHRPENANRIARLNHLPDSCAASAAALKADRLTFEEFGVFPPRLIDDTIQTLESYNDADLRSRLQADPSLTDALVARYFHCG